MNIKQMNIAAWAALLIVGTFGALLMYGIAQGAFQVSAGRLPVGVVCGLGVLAAVAMLLAYTLTFRMFGDHGAPDLPMSQLLPSTLKGFGICAAYFLVVVAVLYAVGAYRVSSFGESFMALLQALSYYLLVAVGEEIAFRGFMFRWIDSRFGLVAALVVSSVLFGLIHVGQGDLLSCLAIAVEAGLLLGAAYRYAGNLWLPIGMHWGWNFAQGSIFGFSVSGTDGGASLIKPTLTGLQWLTGGEFGAEASVVAIVIGLALGLWFAVQAVRRQRQQPAQIGIATAES